MTTFAYAALEDRNIEISEVLRKFAGYSIHAGCLFVEQRGETKELSRLLETAKKGDLVLVDTALSLGSNAKEIIANWRRLRAEKTLDIRFMDQGIMDTRVRGSDLYNEQIADYAIEVAESIVMAADKERKRLQREGIDKAMLNGTQFGRQAGPLPSEFEKYKDLYLSGRISGREAADSLGMPKSSFFYRIKHRK